MQGLSRYDTMVQQTRLTFARGLVEIAEGRIGGYDYIQKFGRNPDLDMGADEDLWELGGDYSFLSSAETLYISSSASDAVHIHVEGLDADWNPITLDETLDGHDQIPIGQMLRVFRAFTDDATTFSGSVYIAQTDDTSDGVPATASKIHAVINPVMQQTHMGIWTCKAGFQAYIPVWYANIGKNLDGEANLMVRDEGKVFLSKDYRGVYQNSPDFETFVEVPAKSDVKIRCSTERYRARANNNTSIQGGFLAILVEQ